MTKICILDYGSGNTGSVLNLFKSLSSTAVVTRMKKDIIEASHIVLPGVGSFHKAMESIHSLLPMQTLEHCVFDKKTPFLGICVGMQVLSTTGEEFGSCKGLNWIPGKVQKLPTKQLLLPHVGWNDLTIINTPELFSGLGQSPDFYFLHSYHFRPADPGVCIAKAFYGEPFCAAVQKNNIFGVQFHPEKSQNAGKKMISNFLKTSTVRTSAKSL